MSASSPAQAFFTGPQADDFWEHPRTSVEIRERLRAALLEELGDAAEQRRGRLAEVFGHASTRQSPADLLFLVDELIAQVRREVCPEKDGTR